MYAENIICQAVFVKRKNRFIAEVEINGQNEIVHVKNTGRCKELLVPGCEVWLTEPGSPGRKTRYALVAVRKSTGVLFNIDSQAPNKVVMEWLAKQKYTKVIPESIFIAVVPFIIHLKCGILVNSFYCLYMGIRSNSYEG
ncbi:MAG: hypothetical protein K6B68_10785 [Eubacterium sp.]|nr:hypothetical protein [Eubacterium sp.]